MNTRSLWAPWRLAYLESLGEKPAVTTEARAASEAAAGSDFLEFYWNHPDHDAEHLVIFRDDAGMILLNRYPYSNGHLMVALGEARPRLLDYDPPQRAALWLLTEKAIDLVERAFHPQGVNVGINQGRAAGAGLPQHLHVHLVPRWAEDTNFMTVVGDVRVIPEALQKTYERYRTTLAKGST